ncbi:GNAT family N-acetyltransferase [Poriferisphaera sp. WC338]|uniref:GNAT family N-acetyltransferase n=1 Tax=Poriferisphaera sp. WC338 TaxID=3425129 RepID=UPI003D81C197
MTDNAPLRIVTIEKLTQYEAEAVMLFGHEILDAFMQDLNTKSSDNTSPLIIGVVDDNNAKLVAGAFVYTQPALHTLSIKQLIIPPNLRGRGLAGKLLYRIEQLAKKRDVTCIRTTAGFGCKDHRRMYLKLSFIDIPQDQIEEQQPYLMQRQID